VDTPAIEIQDLQKTFHGGVVALHGLDLRVERGVVYGLIGRNGAGKTTALRALMGLLRAERGSARVLGEDMWTAPRAHRRRVAYVSQTLQLHAWMTVAELAHYASHFYDRWDADLSTRLLRRFDLPDDRQAGLLSGGQQRLLAMALAVAARPEVLVLDEPAAGLDPVARRTLVEVLIDLLADNEGASVLFSTHILADVERLAEYVGVMDRGRLVTSDRLDNLQGQSRRVQAIFPGDRVPNDVRIPGTLRMQTEGPVLTALVRLEDEAQLAALRALEGVRVNVYPLGLEDLFVELFGGESGEVDGWSVDADGDTANDDEDAA
jgi:ABC-2 type transport system ATP-binding protein